MRTQIRAVTVGGVTAALLLCLVAVAPGGAQADDAAHRRAVQVLRSVTAAFAPAHRAPGTRLPYRDVGLLLRQLRAVRGDLSPSERATADRYAARSSVGGPGPSATCADDLLGTKAYATPEGHFCVHYYGDGTQAQQDGAVLEYAWSVEVGSLGFRAPLDDGDGRIDIDITQDLGAQGIYGYCTTTTSSAQSPAYCALDNDFDPSQYGAPAYNSLRVTAAHEFFHAIQFGYNADQETWAMEGSAVWAEDQVYPDVNDYLQYLPYSPIRHPGTPIDTNTGLEPYGIVVFWKFLAEYLGDPGAVRSFWEYADAPAGRTALQAVEATLAARGRPFGSTFARFGAWNTLPNGSYGDRHLWPAPTYAVGATLGAASRRLATRAFDLNHLTSTALLIRPGRPVRRVTRLLVSVNGPGGSTSPQALIQLRMRNGTVRYYPVPLNSVGDGRKVVSFNRRYVSSVVLTLSNASLARADGQRFYASARMVR